jgi:hypothetical protein
MKIIILIIASSNHDKYIEMQEIWRKYMNMYPNIQSYFIKNDPSIEQDVLLKEDTIYCRENETYMPGITNKTVLAIDYCLQHYQFDYIYRTNLSSVLHLQNLYEFCLNNSLNYGGVIGNHEGINYASGCGFLLSKEACIYLITHKEKLLKHQYLDDVCIGIILKPIFGIQPINRCDIYIEDRDNNEKYIVNKDLFHYRCKSDHDHWYTTHIMNKLYDMIYRV